MQKRLHSLIEVVSGTLVAYVISVTAGIWIYPAFGMPLNLGANMGVTACFTAISIARGYLWRRLFNWLHSRPPASTKENVAISAHGTLYRSVRSMLHK